MSCRLALSAAMPNKEFHLARTQLSACPSQVRNAASPSGGLK